MRIIFPRRRFSVKKAHLDPKKKLTALLPGDIMAITKYSLGRHVVPTGGDAAQADKSYSPVSRCGENPQPPVKSDRERSHSAEIYPPEVRAGVFSLSKEYFVEKYSFGGVFFETGK